MKIKIIIFSLLLIFGLVLRVYRLDSRPGGFTWDEAALGYNAYSLLKTGRDEHGQSMPIIFKSFGDFKPGLFIYFTVPSIALLGLTEFSTRLPSAIFGTVLLAVIFVLTRILFPRQGNKLALLVTAVAALNPWLIHFSRGAWEANLNLLLTALGITLLLRKKYLTAAFFLGTTFLTYQSAKMFTPLLLTGFLAVFRPRIKIVKILFPLGLLALLILPVFLGIGEQSGRLKVYSLFSYTRTKDYVSQILHEDGIETPGIIYNLYHTEILDQARGALERYLNHFSPRFLFVEGDWANLRNALFRQGNFFIPEVFTLLIGLAFLSRKFGKSSLFILVWLGLAPLSSALSRDQISAVRSLGMAVPLCIVIGAGLYQLLDRKLLAGIYALVFFAFFGLYVEMYYFHQPFYAGVEWVNAYKTAWAIVRENSSDYSRVVFTDKLGQPYIFGLFYLKYDPDKYQSQSKFIDNPVGDVGSVPGFDHYTFQPVFWPQLRGLHSTIVVGNEFELPEKDLNFNGLKRLGEVTYPNGSHALRVVGLK